MNTLTAEADLRAAERRRRTFWAVVLVWALASWFIGLSLSDRMRFRVNNLDAVPGSGHIMRDQEGAFFHVNQQNKARQIYPELEAPVYQQECIDCSLVTGEQMSRTNDFCASATKAQLPSLDFETPCRTWAPMGDGERIMAFVVFIVPLVLYPVLRAILDKLLNPAKPAGRPAGP